MTTLAPWFEKRVDRIPFSGCYIWTGHVNFHGYGVITRRKEKLYAHRATWESINGPLPVGRFALHTCDVKCCVNPNHIYAGTLKENSRDWTERGPGNRGESNGQSKLTAANVKEIFASDEPTLVLAKKFSISRSNVQFIKNRKAWKHVWQ